MQEIAALTKRYGAERARWPFQPSPEFGEAGLTLGRGTVLARHALDASDEGLADGERLVVLLSAVHGQPDVATLAARAAAHWRDGRKALAHIMLAHARLPRLDEDDAFRLFLAGSLLDDGMAPRDLARGLGLDLMRYAPDQPRVPAGNPDGGQWTFGDAPAAAKPKTIVVAADTKTPDGYILSEKNLRDMKKRNFTAKQIDDTIRYGPRIDARNKKTGGPAVRYVDPETNQSVVVDSTTKEVIQIGRPDFKFGPGGGDLPGAVMRPSPEVKPSPGVSSPPATVIEEEPLITPDIIFPE